MIWCEALRKKIQGEFTSRWPDFGLGALYARMQRGSARGLNPTRTGMLYCPLSDLSLSTYSNDLHLLRMEVQKGCRG